MTNPEPEYSLTYDPTREPRRPDPGPDGPEAGPQPGAEDDEMVGVPGEDPREPSMPHGSAGQDAGSMD